MTNLKNEGTPSKKETVEMKNMNQTEVKKIHIQKVQPSKIKVIAEPGCRPIGS